MQSETADKKTTHGLRHSTVMADTPTWLWHIQTLLTFQRMFVFCFNKERRIVIIKKNNRQYLIQSPYWSQKWSNGVSRCWRFLLLGSCLAWYLLQSIAWTTEVSRPSPTSSRSPHPNQTENTRQMLTSFRFVLFCLYKKKHSFLKKKKKHHISQ